MVTLLDVSAVAGHHAMPAALLLNNNVFFWSKYPFQNRECSLFKYYLLPYDKII